MKPETIAVADGTKLALRVYEPDSPDRGSVVIGGAMGVRQDYYAPFAQWLAGQGWRVTTFDYRGTGDSAPGGQRPCAASRPTCSTGHATTKSVIDRAHAALPDRPLYLLGHSLGAQLPGLAGQPAQGQRHAQRRRGQRLLARQRAAAQAGRSLLLVRAGAVGDGAVRLFPGPPAGQGGRPAGRGDHAMAPMVPEPAVQRGRRRARAFDNAMPMRASRCTRCRSSTTR